MPRGKYDRKVSRINRLSKETEQKGKEIDRLKLELEKAKLSVRAAAPQHKEPLDNGFNREEQMSFLRTSLEALGRVRKDIYDSDGEVTGLVREVDAEIHAHVVQLRELRERVVGVYQAPRAQPTVPEGLVPLPAAPPMAPRMAVAG